MTAPVENLVQRLHARRSGKGWIAKCPAHDDHTPSLSIDEGADGRALLKCHAGCDTDSVLSALGLTKRDLFSAISHRHSSNGSSTARISTPASTFDWQACVDALKPRDLVRLGNERWFSSAFCEWFHENKLIGKFRGDYAFPVRNDGAIVGVHYRAGEHWPYHPPGIKTAPFIIGNPATAKQFHTGESPWDMLSLADRTDWYRDPSVCFISTRGASNAKLVRGLIPHDVSVCAWPQNDKVGEQWLSDLCAHAGGPVAKAIVPAPFKDVNEWTKAGASPEAIYNAWWRNELVEVPKLPSLGTLLDKICAFVRRYISFTSDAQPTVIALWIVHTWFVDAFEFTPYLHIFSPTRSCGKSHLLDCIAKLARNVLSTVSLTVAALFRTIEQDQPTLFN